MDRKLGIFHQLVAQELPEGRAALLAEWAAGHAAELIAEQTAFFSGPDGPDRLALRMTEPEFARKRWVYLYSAHAPVDSETVRAFILPYIDDPDPLMRGARGSIARTDPVLRPWQ